MINDSFRLFLVTDSSSHMPTGFLQDCVKIVIEPTEGLKQNLSSIISQTPMEMEREVPNMHREIYKKLYFLISFYHSVLNERKKYREIGWNESYNFTF